MLPNHKKKSRLIECPKCSAHFLFDQDRVPAISASGLKEYHLNCQRCGVALVAVVDPVDDELLISVLKD